MTTNNQEIIKEIQSKAQFVITITIFFLAVLQKFFIVSSNEAKANDIFMKYSLVVVFYLIFYLLFEWRKDRINSYWLNGIRISLLGGIGFFIFPILTFIMATDPSFAMSWIYATFYFISLQGIFIVPVILMFGLPGEFFVRQVSEAYGLYKTSKKKWISRKRKL